MRRVSMLRVCFHIEVMSVSLYFTSSYYILVIFCNLHWSIYLHLSNYQPISIYPSICLLIQRNGKRNKKSTFSKQIFTGLTSDTLVTNISHANINRLTFTVPKKVLGANPITLCFDFSYIWCFPWTVPSHCYFLALDYYGVRRAAMWQGEVAWP